MKICYHCHKKGFQAEKFIGLKQPKGKEICIGCAIDVFLAVRTIHTSGKAITGVLGGLDDSQK